MDINLAAKCGLFYRLNDLINDLINDLKRLNSL